jgi:hypothetical protein
MRRVALAIVVLLLVTSCGRFVRAGTTAAPGSTASVGSAFASGSRASKGSSEGATSPPTSFTLTVTDHNGLHPAGIPVRITGAITATQTTDASGRIELTRPGVYHFSVSVGCESERLILSGARGTAGVLDGSSSSGELHISWQRRYIPNAPVFSDPLPPWPVGGDIHVSYSVTDRCTNSFAPSVAFLPLAFSTSANLRVVGVPVMRSDAKHMATLVIRCLSAGNVRLQASDKDDRSDTFDLIQDSATYVPPRCG